MSGILKQFLATISCNFLTVSYGMSASWGAPNYLVLTSNDTPLDSGPITSEEASLVVSIPNLGGIIGTFFYAMIIDRFSRRALLVSVAIPQLLGWVITFVASDVYHLYIARLIAGFVGSGTFVVVPVFVFEISDDNVRGALGSMLILASNFGTLLQFAVATFLNYYEQIQINLVIPILFLLTFYFFPESPEYLLKQNQIKAAENSWKFYHGSKQSNQIDERQRLNENETQNSVDKIANKDARLSFSDFSNRAAKRAIIIALFIVTLNQLCGSFTLMNYANKIFRDSGLTLSEDTASVFIGCVQLVANICALFLVDRMGRKLLLTISLLGAFIGLIGMGLYDIFEIYLVDYNWISIVTFSINIFMSSIGILPLTYVILCEILPKKIKHIIVLVALMLIWGLSFVCILIYPTLAEAIGSYNVNFIFAAWCIVGVIFSLTVLPETNRKTYEEIMMALEK